MERFHSILISKIFRLYWKDDKLWRNFKKRYSKKFSNYAYENGMNKSFCYFHGSDYQNKNIYYSEKHNKPIIFYFMKENKGNFRHHNTPWSCFYALDQQTSKWTWIWNFDKDTIYYRSPRDSKTASTKVKIWGQKHNHSFPFCHLGKTM